MFLPSGIIAEFGNITTSFYWCFSDTFIMLLAIGISHRFQQINDRIDYLKGRIVTNERWNNVRLDYVELCELLKFVDDSVGKIILLASLNNSLI